MEVQKKVPQQDESSLHNGYFPLPWLLEKD